MKTTLTVIGITSLLFVSLNQLKKGFFAYKTYSQKLTAYTVINKNKFIEPKNILLPEKMDDSSAVMQVKFRPIKPLKKKRQPIVKIDSFIEQKKIEPRKVKIIVTKTK